MDGRTGLPPRTLVGLSVSDSPDLPALGLSIEHLDHAYLELTRQLLAAGARVAYGGDLRPGGFTERLIDLVNTYSREDRPARDRIVQYLAWPLSSRRIGPTEREQLAALQSVATVVKVPPAPEPDPELSDELRVRVHRAECFTAMRERMTADLDARIILGGRSTGFQGRLPGLAEEAVLAAATGKPVFVLGGFGGCAAAVARLVQGGDPQELRISRLRARDPAYDQLLDALPTVVDDGITAPLNGVGPGGLRNGLGDHENGRLFVSSDIDEVIALILRGLRTLTRSGTHQS